MFDCSDIEMAYREDIINSTGAVFLENATKTLNLDHVNSLLPNVNGNFTFESHITLDSSINPIRNILFPYPTCYFSQVFVESDVECLKQLDDTYCSVLRVREIPPAPLKPLFLEPLQRYFVDAGTPTVIQGETPQGSPTLIERYIADPSMLLHEMTAIDLSKQIPNTPTLELPISRLFNALWQAEFDPMYQTGFYETSEDIQEKLNFTAGQNHHNVNHHSHQRRLHRHHFILPRLLVVAIRTHSVQYHPARC
jgi:hypothetical protein